MVAGALPVETPGASAMGAQVGAGLRPPHPEEQEQEQVLQQQPGGPALPPGQEESEKRKGGKQEMMSATAPEFSGREQQDRQEELPPPPPPHEPPQEPPQDPPQEPQEGEEKLPAPTAAAAAATDATPQATEDKASRAARCHAPLPFQLRRLFFSPSAGDIKVGNRQLKLVHRDPHVYTIDGFLSESEYDYLEKLIDQQYGKFRASYTDDSADSQYVNEDRTSAFISLRKGGDGKVRSVEGRAADIVGVTPECVEPLQMVGYRRHDKFDIHHDMGTYDSEANTVEAVSPRRLVTFFVYLNNLPRGQGHTVFPLLNGGRFSVQPKRLKAVLFCNVLENGEPDLRLLHRADPVREEGYQKFGLNIWITDKNLGALAFSSAGAVLDAKKIVPGKRSILAMIDPPCEACEGRDRRSQLRACDHCDLLFHPTCLPPDMRPPRDGTGRWWTCFNCQGKKPKRGEYCEACDGGNQPHRMLLCDTCERAYHTYCLSPPLKKVPRGEWVCPPCTQRKEKQEAAALKRLKAELGEESEEEEEEEEGPGCSGCGGKQDTDKVLLCDGEGCDAEWHLYCLTPPLKRVPPGEWFCPACAKRREKEAARVAAAEAAERERLRPKVVAGHEGLAPGSFVVLRGADAASELPFTLRCVEAVDAASRTVTLRAIEGGRHSRALGFRFRLSQAAGPDALATCEVERVVGQVPCKAEADGRAFVLLVAVAEVNEALAAHTEQQEQA